MTELSTEVLIPREIRICYKRPLFDDMVFVNSPASAIKALRKFLDDDQLDYKECFWVLALTQSNRLLGISMIAQGTHNCVAVSMKEIVHIAVLTNASAVIVAHNHPSGMAKPSQQDIEITQALYTCLRAFEIMLLDHIIFTSETLYSMDNDGRMPES